MAKISILTMTIISDNDYDTNNIISITCMVKTNKPVSQTCFQLKENHFEFQRTTLVSSVCGKRQCCKQTTLSRVCDGPVAMGPTRGNFTNINLQYIRKQAYVNN